MNILLMTIPVSITLAILFLLFFLSAVSDDQFDDLDTSAQLPLSDDENEPLSNELLITKETTDTEKQESLK